MEENFFWELRAIALMSLTPIVGDRVGEQVAWSIELRGRDGIVAAVELLQPLPVILVPEDEGTVGAGRGERAGAVDRVEVDAVHGEDLPPGVGRAVALEGEVFRCILDVSDGAATLDGAHRVALLVRKATDGASLHLQGGLGRPHRILVLLDVGQVVDEQMPLGAAHDE